MGPFARSCSHPRPRGEIRRLTASHPVSDANLSPLMLETIGKFIAQYWRMPVEIGILAAVLYYIYIYLRGTHGARILIGLALIFLTLTFSRSSSICWSLAGSCAACRSFSPSPWSSSSSRNFAGR